ncbi:putative ATPase (AAA+ superfamily) [Treponema sp. JC4]|uniref:ATP-binding protein n=1 Tax=Treponema sp. JC4 TaxID=1124982 RepID=UPI00025B0C58|nr:AAA family ATPase [Treponema sp. JC4]EID84885.1 putative ATPase (AAA+ superfamily) [Treponema sp. JC4]
MYRKIIEDLKNWKNSQHRKPLILQGARQTGKTWIMKEFGRMEYQNTAYLFSQENQTLQNLFEAPFDKERLLNGFQLLCGFKIEPEKTLIIIDEIQDIPKAITALKFFYEQAPEYHIICAGSLLGVSLHEGVSFPVGKVNFLNLYPLSFSEFLMAIGKEQHAALINSSNPDAELIKSFSADFTEFLRYYFFIGGMPEVVSTWIETKDFNEVRRVQKELLRTYENDVSKHTSDEMANKIKQVWDSVPSQLARENKKFLYSVVKESARAREYENAINWLSNAGLLTKVFRINKSGIPIKAYEDLDAFKIFILDTGLLCSMTNLSAKVLLEDNKLFTEFKGSLTEQFVCQQLISEFGITPYYWSSKDATAEIDFIFQNEDEIIPVEVKARINLKAKSLKQYRETYSPETAFRFSLSDYVNHGVLKDVPLYALPMIRMFLK